MSLKIRPASAKRPHASKPAKPDAKWVAEVQKQWDSQLWDAKPIKEAALPKVLRTELHRLTKAQLNPKPYGLAVEGKKTFALQYDRKPEYWNFRAFDGAGHSIASGWISDDVQILWD